MGCEVFHIGVIYKIENKINKKMYIGMTTRNIQIRIRDHERVYNDSESRSYNFKLYKTMRKYGFENFEFSTIEECDNSILGEKEKYYIKLYDTVNNGYNEALGGNGKPLWTDKQIEACKVLYDNGWLLKDIAEVFKSNPSTVGKKMREKYNINTKENSVANCSKKVCGYNKNGEHINFDSLSDAAKYLIENDFTKSNCISGIVAKITESINKNRSAYEHKWEFMAA